MTDNGHYYSVWVDSRSQDQGYDTGYGSGHDTEHQAIEEMHSKMLFVLSLGKIVTKAEITKVCTRCNGGGTVFVPQKRNPRLGKNKRCPDCKGKNSDVVTTTWIDIPFVYRQSLANQKIVHPA